MPPWKPGQSGNPNGRPKLKRSPTQALREINDTPGEDVGSIIERFALARGTDLCAADLKAIAAFRREMNTDAPFAVAQQNATLDRLEGKVTQPINQETNATVRFVFGTPDAPVVDEGDPE